MRKLKYDSKYCKNLLITVGLNVLEYLIRANETPLDAKSPHDCVERLSFQKKAMTELVIIGYIAVMAMEQKCILAKQCEQISGLVTDHYPKDLLMRIFY